MAGLSFSVEIGPAALRRAGSSSDAACPPINPDAPCLSGTLPGADAATPQRVPGIFTKFCRWSAGSPAAVFVLEFRPRRALFTPFHEPLLGR